MQFKRLIIIAAVILGLTGATAFALEAPESTTATQPVETQAVSVTPTDRVEEPTPEPVVSEPAIAPEPVTPPAQPEAALETPVEVAQPTPAPATVPQLPTYTPAQEQAREEAQACIHSGTCTPTELIEL